MISLPGHADELTVGPHIATTAESQGRAASTGCDVNDPSRYLTINFAVTHNAEFQCVGNATCREELR
jgi:hypothetical protein